MKTILCIEDNIENLKVMQLMVERLRPNDRFVSAGTAEEGLVLIAQVKPDLIMMDINLPGMSGYEALEILKRTDTRMAPVIAISADAMENDVNSGLAAGFELYITKPIDMRFLQLALDKYLHRTRIAQTG